MMNGLLCCNNVTAHSFNLNKQKQTKEGEDN